MRIGIVTPNPPSYSETFIRKHIEGLPASAVWWGEPLPRLRQDGIPVVPRWRRALTRLEVAILHAPAAAEDRPLAHRLRRGFDVVLAEYGPVAARLLPACLRAGVPLVAHFHGYDASRRDVLAANADGYRRLFAAAAAIVVPAEEMRQRLLRLGAPPSRVEVVPYGVEPELFTGATPGSAPPVFVGVGRFVEKKGPLLTLAAFGRLADEFPAARLTLIGDGPLRGPCGQLATSLGLGARVDLPGALEPAAVAVAMRGARAFVQHSLEASDGDREGLPVAILEAGASGLPVVATRHAGIPEVVTDGETGLLVAEGDVAAMAGAMLRLARDPALAARLGDAARRRVVERCSLGDTLARLRRVLASARSRTPGETPT